jgi:hypothetical protein
MVFVRVIHPGVPIDRYLVEVHTARVWSLKSSSFQKMRRPRWLFSSLYWPLPRAHVQCRMRSGQLSVSFAWHPTPSVSIHKRVNNGGYTVYGTGPPKGCSSEEEARRFMERFRNVVTEAAIAVSGPLCRVDMFLGETRIASCVSITLLKALTGPLIDASRCRTVPT